VGKICLIAVSIVLFVSLVSIGLHQAKQAHQLGVIKTRLSFLAVSLKEYVREHGEFPPDMNVLMKEMSNTNMMQSVFGEEWTYRPPNALDPGSTPVLIVTQPRRTVLVDKSFTMRVLP
jgi:hypothetical protein